MSDNEKKKNKVFLRTFGCQMNVRDSEVVAGLLKREGYSLVEAEDKADIVIFNTCSVRQHAEDKVWSEIGRIAKSAKKNVHIKGRSTDRLGRSKAGTGPIIGLIGCMAQNYKEHVFQRSPAVDFVVGPSDIDKIPSILERLAGARQKTKSPDLYELKIWETDADKRPEEIYHTGFYEDKEHAYVVISEGCSNFCSYCVVPFVRGPLHNRDNKEILKEIEQAVSKGISKITLLGQNVNAYVHENVNFVELVSKVNKVKGLKEFSFITSHPKDTTVELFKAMAECDKIKKALHLPVQSGSDKVLKEMNRGYTKKFYLDLVDNYRKIVKNGELTTDIIVGFPGETEKEFQETYELVKQVQFDAAYIFKYSPRPNTHAQMLLDDLSKEEKEKRHKAVLDLQKSVSLKKRKANKQL